MTRRRPIMRSSRRYAILAVASVAAVAVGGLAYANHVSNVSSLPVWKVTPRDAPKDRYVKGSLKVRTHTNYAHPGDKSRGGFARKVTLHFDNDGKIRLRGIPSCTADFGSGTTLKRAWNRCGPGAGANRNAYLSPRRRVSGRASTAPPSNFDACTLVFKRGRGKILLFARVKLVPNGTANCRRPGSNTSGNTSVTLVGTLGDSPIPDFGKKFTVPKIDQLALPLDDFSGKVKRGRLIRVRCHDGNKVWNLRGRFAYSGSGQPADVVNKRQTCL
jgi:hypothetical protein